MDIHGKPRNVTWTTLNATSHAGQNTIVVSTQGVDWQRGEQIVISTTSYVATHTEVFTILAVYEEDDLQTILLDGNLAYDHLSFVDGGGGSSVTISAAVGLLSRNVKVVGAEYSTQDTDLYGFTALVTSYTWYDVPYASFFTYMGYTRLTNVEFIHAGQFERGGGGGINANRPFGLLYANKGVYDQIMPTYVLCVCFATKCTIN